MATTSGTVGQTTIDVSTFVEKAYRRCGKLASTISSELQISAKENLFLLLSDLANRGTSLWCIQKTVLAVNSSQTYYPMPAGTVDVNTALYRTKTDLTGTTINGAGWQGLSLPTATVVNTVSVSFATATVPTLVVESSADNVSWTLRASLSSAIALPAATLVCADVDNSATASFWRVRDTSGVLASVTSLVFSTLPNELPLSKMSNDDYAALPDKTGTGAKALQFWYDKQINPRIWVWPVPQAPGDQIVVWTQRHIQDVGAFTNTVEIPQRWYESVLLTLACRCALELPAGELPEGRYELLKGLADEHLLQAEDGESDGSPIRIAPRIGGYTR